MRHNVIELEGALLDMAVAMAEGYKFGAPQQKRNPEGGLNYWVFYPVSRPGEVTLGAAGLIAGSWGGSIPSYSTDWDVAGPIIERERIELHPSRGDAPWEAGPEGSLEASGMGVSFCGSGQAGPSPLVAAMRSFVASKFGKEIELP